MKRSLRVAFLVAGLVVLGILSASADWRAIRDLFARIGWYAPLALLPYLLVYLVDTWAWSVTFARRPGLPFGRLFQVRWIGEAVNNLVPTGYVGGEAVKVLLLRRAGVAVSESAGAAVISKTAQTLAQALFVSLGAILLAELSTAGKAVRTTAWATGGVALLGTAGLLMLQRRGLAAVLVSVLNTIRVRSRWVERHRPQLQAWDDRVRTFYQRHPRRFLASAGLYLGGWLLDAVEIGVVGHLMGFDIVWQQALAIEAFIGVAKVLGLFVPGAVGVQESGIVLLCRLAELPGPFGYAYALWRRGRELLYAGIGWLLFAAQGSGWRDLEKPEGTV